jgi:hypothetical protein
MKDYKTHPDFNPSREVCERYYATIHRIGEAFKDGAGDKESQLAAAYADLREFTPGRCRDSFGLGSNYSLAKEFFHETIAANAAIITRILTQRGDVSGARTFMLELYAKTFDAGFSRGREFLANRLDSRTFMPMRKHIDREYLGAIGYTHPDNILLCVGDCQTVILAEMLRDTLPLPGMDIASYQHEPGSLIGSPLDGVMGIGGFLMFCKLGNDYAILGKRRETREIHLQTARDLVDWLSHKQPKRCVFVTHVFFGVDNAVRHLGLPREVCMDAVTDFSDELAVILAGAPGAHLINFQEICPFDPGPGCFRDAPDTPWMLHFRFDIMDAVSRRIVEAFQSPDD